MLHEGHAVRLSGTNLHGYTRRYDSATGGNRWWLCEWEDGTASVAAEAVLVDVERQEWADAMRGVAEHLRCPSIGAGSAAGGRRCGMRAGHRTQRHRNAEISWADEMAQE